MVHSRRITIEELEKALKEPNRLYKRACINWGGSVSDAEKGYYTEIISEKLLESDFMRDGHKYIDVVERKKSYRMHDDIVNKKRSISNREEEIFAKILKKNKNLDLLGDIIDYQVPLKDTNKDAGVGKIDLVSINKNENVAYIIELKYADNAETLLKAILEIWTYWYQLKKDKFLSDFDLPTIKNIRRAVLLVVGCRAYKEARELKSGKRKNLEELVRRLDVDIFLLDRLTKIKCT